MVDMTGWKQFTVNAPDGRRITLRAPSPAVAIQGAQLFVQRNPAPTDGLTAGAQRVRQQRDADQAAVSHIVGTALDGPSAGGRSGTHSMSVGLDTDILPAAAAGVQGLVNAYHGAVGDPITTTMGDRYSGERQAMLDQSGADASAHPGWSIAGSVAGALAGPGATAAGKLISAPTIAARTIQGTGTGAKMARAVLGGAEVTAKSSAIGAGTGAVMAEQSAPQDQRADAAVQGAQTGAAVGAVLPAGGAIAGKVGGVLVDKVAAPIINTVTRAANKATGGALLDPETTAIARVTAALKADGVDPGTIRSTVNQWLITGSPPPSLMNVGGENTRALLRVAAMNGPARDAAQSFADQQAADLQPTVIQRTQALTPDSRTPDQVTADLTAQRAAQASAQYPQAYATPVQPDEPVTGALQGKAGASAIGNAYKLADANRLNDQALELRQLGKLANTDPEAAATADATGGVNGTPKVPQGPVTLGTLDQIKQSFYQMADDAAAKGDAGLARGYTQRADELDQHMADLSPEYATARDGYAANSAKLAALNAGDINPAAASPADTRATMAGIAPDDQALPGIQLRQNIVDAVGSPTAGATGILNRLSSSTNAGQNLAAVYGDQPAADYQTAVANAVKRVQDARFVAPNTGAKTANVLSDASMAGEMPATPPHSIGTLIASGIAKIRAGATMTDAERLAMVRLGQMHAENAANIPGVVPQPSTPLLPAYVPVSGSLAGQAVGADQDPNNQ